MGVNKKQAQLFSSFRAADILISPFEAGWLSNRLFFLQIKNHKNDYSDFSLYGYNDIMELYF
jgi:hypothetical protein